jgi:DNA-binding NarL/FixJ family response regulator
MTVFLVEDSQNVRDRFLHEFESMNNVAVAGLADAAAEAVAGIQRTQPHLVVLDLNLSQGSGMDVLRALKRWEAPPMVYVVSNVADEVTRTLCLRAGAAGFFDKSTELDEFFRAVSLLAAA